MEKSLVVPGYVYETYKTIVKSGFEAFIVGGSVRDVLMGRTAKDWDITTNATPEQVQSLFVETFYENAFGTVGIPCEANMPDGETRNVVVEVTTYRSESEYSDFRRPGKIEWGKTLEEDLERRDFTINAITLKIENLDLEIVDFGVVLESGDYKIIDPYGGLVDLQSRIIKTVGVAEARFHEDALRMMRAIRFFAQLDFAIDETAISAIQEKSNNIIYISGERIRDELWKILSSDRAYEGIIMLDNVGLLKFILPELMGGKEMAQKGHHVYDVFTHSVNALKYCPSKNPVVKLAALLHDIGKSITADGEGEARTFYNHDIVGGKMVSQIATRLRLSKKDKEKLYILIRYHMFSVDTIQTDAAIRRFIVKVGLENINDMIDVRIGDRLGSGTKTAKGWRLVEFKKRIEELLMPTFTVKDLVVDGRDVMRILNIPPGPKIGIILSQLFDEVLEDIEKNNVGYLERRVKELGKV
ncbi:MAG: CCA tRNA nucleotidyltransferase [bacterium]|nr:CCA tRNA nucleotidyltransferase [bacterium]